MDVFDLVAKISLDTSEYNRGLNDASERTSGFGSKVRSAFGTFAKVGGAALTAATGATVAFGKSAVEAGMSFDATMSQVGAISGATGAEFDSLRDKAIEMGSKTKFSASESGEALTYMAMAGWKTSDMLNGIEGIMNLAAASGEDLASTSDIVTDALTGFGLSAEDSGHFADVLAAASSNANTNVSMLGESFKYVAPVAGALGYSVEDTSVALGLMANSGIKASQAGTTLRTAITNMASPTKNMAAVMEEYGLSLTDADGNMLSLQEVMGQLREKMGGLDQATQASATSMLFGKEAMSGMLAIINTSDADFDKLTAAISDCDGAANSMAKTMNDNLAGDITLFKSALEGAQIVVSDQLTPSLREFVQFGTEAIGTLSTAFQNGGLSGAMEALGTILSDGLNMVIAKLPDMVDAGMKLLGALGQGLLNNLPAITTAAVQIVLTLLQGLISALPAMAQGAVMMISQLAMGIGQALPELIPAAVDAVVTFVENLTSPGSLNMIIDGALQLILGLVQGIANALPRLIAAAPVIIMNLVWGLIANLPKIAEAALQIVISLAVGLIKAIPELLKAIPQMIKALVTGILSFAGNLVKAGGDLINALGKGISDAWQSIVDFFTGAFSWLGDIFNDFWGWITGSQKESLNTMENDFSSSWDHISSDTESAWSGMEDQVGSSLTAMADMAGSATGKIENTVDSNWGAAALSTDDNWNGMADTVVGSLGLMSTETESATGDMNGFIDSAWSNSAISTEMNFMGMERKVDSSLTNMVGITNTSTGDIVQTIDQGWANAYTYTENGLDSIVATAGLKSGDAVNAVESNFGKMKGTVLSNMDLAKAAAMGQDWGGVGTNIVDGMSAGVNERARKLANSVANAANMALEAARNAIQSHSPSQVFRKKIGWSISEGMAVGVEDKEGQVVNSILSITDSIQEAFDPTFAMNAFSLSPNLSDLSPRTVDYTPYSPTGGSSDASARPGSLNVIINSPQPVDAVQAAREWKKTSQQMAMGFI